MSGSHEHPNSLRSLAFAAVIVLVVLANLLFIGPRPSAMPDQTTGDARLGQTVADSLGDRPGIRAAAVAVVTPESTRYVGFGTVGPGDEAVNPITSRFEIGSLTKPLTGMLMASMAPTVVEPEDELNTLVRTDRIQSSALGHVTLARLAEHRSGLPRLPLSPSILAGSFISRIGAHDPYPDWSPQRLLEVAAETELGGEEFAYSNLGGAVVGQALASAADRPYRTLLQDRILGPVGMDDTEITFDHDELPENHVDGTDEFGRAQSPWVSRGFAPAGVGVWSTTEDLGLLLEAILDGTAPGIEATEPTTEIETAGARAIGYFWLTSESDGDTITWHDGATGGFRSWMGFNRDTETGAVILTSGSNDRLHELGLHLLDAGEAPVDLGRFPGWYGIVVVLILTFTTWRSCRQALHAWRGDQTDVVGVIQLGAEVIFIFTLGWVLGPWTILPWALWSLLATAAAIGLVGVIWWNRSAPWFRGGRWRVVNALVGTALTVAALVVVI